MAIMFVVNLLVLVPIAGIAAYPQFEMTVAAFGAFATAGLLGSLLDRVGYFVGSRGSARAVPNR